MFGIGEKVLYGVNGVCSVEGVTVRRIGKTDIEYYVLKPLSLGSSTLFVPTSNAALCSKMRGLLSAEQIRSVLSDAGEGGEWIENKSLRGDSFKGVISRGDFSELIAMIRLIRAHEATAVASGKRLHASDERLLREAEKMVSEEISIGLGVDRSEALGMVFQ